MIESSAMTNFGMVMKLYPNIKAVKLDQYIVQIRSILNSTDSILTDVYSISDMNEKI